MSQIIIITGGCIGLIIAIGILCLLYKKENNKGIVILEYDNKNGDSYHKIGINFKKKKMKVYYDNNCSIYKIPKKVKEQITKIFNDYQILKLEKSELLLEDNDNISIYYEMCDGRKKYINKEEYADCDESVFKEIRKVLEKCLP